MKVSLMRTAVLVLGFLAATATPAAADEIKILAAVGFRGTLDNLGPKFEHSTGNKLTISFATLGDALKRIQSGETADVIIILQQGFETLAGAGRVSASDMTVLARTGVSVAIREGAPAPDISSAEALRGALLSAKSITYSNPVGGGASGVHFAKVLDRLGIANEVKAKTVFPAKADEVGLLVAKGEAEIGVAASQVLILVRGINVVGPLPGDLQETATLVGVVSPGTRIADAAKAFVDYLRTPEAAAVIKANGMEPVSW